MNSGKKKFIIKRVIIAFVITLAILLINSLVHQYQYCKMILPEIPLSASPYSNWILDNLKNSYLGIFTYPALWGLITLILCCYRKAGRWLRQCYNTGKRRAIDALVVEDDEDDEDDEDTAKLEELLTERDALKEE